MDNRLNSPDSADVELDQLVQLFFDDPSQLGEFSEIEANQVPEPSRSLLAHDQHMTVTVEKHHRSPVDVKVLQSRIDETHYSRKILLTRQSDGKVVQYGIVRLNRAALSTHVRDEIERQEIPLGRILINHDVLRVVRLLNLFEIHCGPDLATEFDFEVGQVCYGRTALIYCDGAPAIELLEIVS